MKHYGIEVADGTHISNLVVATGTSYPSLPDSGELFFRTDTDTLHVYNGTDWESVSSGASSVLSVNSYTGTVVLTKSDIGLSNVDNTSDVNKPVSTATQTALNLKAPLASPTFTGNITLSGTGNRITGDFSNAIVADRVMFQTSTVNSQTTVSVIPNGTNTQSAITVFGDSNPTNAPSLGLVCGSLLNEARISSNGQGTFTHVPMTFHTGGSERLRIDTSGNVGIGTPSPTAKLEVAGSTLVSYSAADVTGVSSRAVFTVINTESGAGVAIAGNSSTHTDGTWGGTTLADAGVIRSQGAASNGLALYTGIAVPITFWTNSAERLRIDGSGNVGIGGNNPGSYGQLGVFGSGYTSSFVSSTAGVVGVMAANSNSELRVGTLSGHPLSLYANNAERARIDTSGITTFKNSLYVDNGSNDGAGVRLNSTGYGHWEIDNVNGTFRFMAPGVTGAVAAAISPTGSFAITNPSGFGYGTGAGGTVTQATSRLTAVTINKPTGTITLVSAVYNASTYFIVYNNTVSASDTVLLSQATGANKYWFAVTNVSAGQFSVYSIRLDGTATEAPAINFAIIRGATS